MESLRTFICASAALCAVIVADVGGEAFAAERSGAIGQIVPAGGVVSLAGPQGAIVREIRVRPGDVVKAGTVLMFLAGDNLKAEQELAAQVFKAAKASAESQIAAQKNTVDLAAIRLSNTTRELNTYQSLGSHATAAGELARLQSASDEARLTLKIEQSRLATVTADASKPVHDAERRAQLADTSDQIVAPSDGTILRILQRAGQRLTPDAAIQMGDLRTMYVTCQVYEGDLLQIKPGMKATVKNAALSQPLTGTVEEIGRIVNTQARLGEVRIRLDSTTPADHLVGMEVEVAIAH